MKLISPQLQTFLAIVKCKTMHAAAEVLHITQTAVTQRLHTLETRLSTSLFVRSKKGMILTKEGEALLRYCQQVAELEGETLSFITRSGTGKNIPINIVGPTTIMHTRIIPQCLSLTKNFPRLLFHFDIDDSENPIKKLRRSDAEFAIANQNFVTDEMNYKKLQSEHYILVASAKWKDRSLHDIIQNERIIDFNAEDTITFDYLKHFNLYEIASKNRHFANRTHSLAMMISRGLGYGVLPLDFAKPFLETKELISLNDKKTMPISQVLAWYKRHQEPSYFSAVVKICL